MQALCGRVRPSVTSCNRPHARRPEMPDALVERDDHTMIITMNRPQRYNALLGGDARADVRRDGRGLRRRRHPVDRADRRGRQLLLGSRPARHGGRRRGHRPRDRRPGTHGRRPRHRLQGTAAAVPAVEAVHRRGRGCRHRRRHRDSPADRHPRRRRIGTLRRERGALVAVPDGGIRRPPAPPDPLHPRRRDPAHREAPPRGRGRAASVSSATSCPTARRSPRHWRSPRR